MWDARVIALFLLACEPTTTDGKTSETSAGDTGIDSVETDSDSDTGVEPDSPSDTDTGDPWPVDTCEATFGPSIVYPAAGPCDPALPWIDVSGGVMQTCAVKSDGCGQCWGARMDTTDYAVPAVAFQSIRMTSGLDTWDEFHVCGLTHDGRPLCWGGPNDHGENAIPEGVFVAVSTGTTFANAIRDDGSILEWGHYEGCAPGPYSEVVTSWVWSAELLADGTLELGDVDRREPVPGVWATIAIGHQWVCGIRTDLDNSLLCVDKNDGTEISLSDLPWGRFLDVCVGNLEGCALDEFGATACFSYDPAYDSLAYPPPGPFVAITCGFSHACALTAEGEIECWGDDYYGETIPPS